MATTKPLKALAPVDPGRRALEDLLARVDRGDAEAVRTFRRSLAFPESADLFGTLERQAEAALLATFTAPEDRVSREVIQHRMDTLRTELAGAHPTPLERLLIDRIVACWLQVQLADHRVAVAEKAEITFKQGEYHRDRQDRAHRRYLQAITTLARVRRLQLPALQINMAHQQVVTGAGPDPAELGG